MTVQVCTENHGRILYKDNESAPYGELSLPKKSSQH